MWYYFDPSKNSLMLYLIFVYAMNSALNQSELEPRCHVNATPCILNGLFYFFYFDCDQGETSSPKQEIPVWEVPSLVTISFSSQSSAKQPETRAVIRGTLLVRP